MMHSLLYIGTAFLGASIRGRYKNPRGQNLLDGGAPFYRIY